MKYSGPLGLPRLTGMGFFASEDGDRPMPEPRESEDREEFMERCMAHETVDEWAIETAEAFGFDPSDDKLEEVKMQACVGLSDNREVNEEQVVEALN